MRTLSSWLVLLIALPILASAENWKGTILDVHCKGMDPASHTRQCALDGAKHGLGLATTDGRFLKFDKSGNAKALTAINATKEEKLAAEVAGTLKGDTIRVESVQIVGAQPADNPAAGGTSRQMPDHRMGAHMSHGAMGMAAGDKAMDCPMMKMNMSAPANKNAKGDAKAMDMSAHGACCNKMGAPAVKN